MSTDKRVTIGMIGAGWWPNTMHMPALAACDQANVVAVCDLIPERAEAIARKYSIPHTFTDYQELEKTFMKIRKLDHVSFLVQDVERSRRFYTQVLGLRELVRPGSVDNIGGWFTNDEHSFEVHIIGEAEAGRVAQMHPPYRRDEVARGHGTHAAFELENVEATIQHLRALNVEIVGGPRPRGDGVQQVFICDPDGYVIELFVREAR
jgi:catechol 2,3-dioxygenase-like lactoylglutathione lyase family enzyme